MNPPNFYAGLGPAAGFDRAAEHRRDAAWIAGRLRAPEARFVPVWRTKSLIAAGEAPAPVFATNGSAEAVWDSGLHVYLGEAEEGPYFALSLSHLDESEALRCVDRAASFADLRTVGALLDRRSGALLAYARGLLHWHERHRYCGVCGSPTRSESAGHVRVCENPACASQHFPRTDPAVIMLVTDGERCLLGRNPRLPPGMHSTLAGFVEPGESLEDAVRREVREETGVEVGEVVYHSSQPWPFPSSIMLGFRAHALSRDIAVDPEELESACWYTRAFLLAPHDPEVFRLPRADSIARRLIDDWIAGR